MTGGFEQNFLEEARELLGELEAALLELDRNPGNPETVGRAFRALHTIKGSGAMFGFDEVAAFAHNLEAAFDQLRNGKLKVTAELISLSLAAGDQIRGMLDASTGRGAVDPKQTKCVLAGIRRLTGAAESSAKAAPPVDVPVPPPGALTEWRIHFRPGPQFVANGMNPVLLLGELRQLGELRIAIDVSAIPPLAEIDPERCYLAWDMVLETAAGYDGIRDVFIFIGDDCELKIEPAGGSGVETVAPPAEPAGREAPQGQVAAGQPVASSVRVAAGKLDQLLNLVGELVTIEARLSEISTRRDDPEMLAVAEEVGRLTAELRETSMGIRLLPLRNTFERFRRLVHDLGIELGKQAELVIEGAGTELDKTVIEQLNDPLVHLIRNSMDHGLENPAERRAAGKPAAGAVHLSARHSGAQVLIRVSDDGRGLDVEAVRARALQQGLIDPSARLSESELLSLILAPGFSTARQVTDISGRGVGMDVVRRSVEALRGSIELANRPGEGLAVTLRLPLTMAIIDGLLVRVGRTHFVLPLANSLECIELTRRQVEESHGNHLAAVRGETIPYIRLSEFFQMDTPPPEREQIMVVETEDGHYGLAVDDVLGNHQTVIKNLGRLYRDVPMVSGATILGNGTVALILDPDRLVRSAVQMLSERRKGGRKQGQAAARSSQPPAENHRLEA